LVWWERRDDDKLKHCTYYCFGNPQMFKKKQNCSTEVAKNEPRTETSI
jgi:hypothetical protein